jgi:hypothetical protein
MRLISRLRLRTALPLGILALVGTVAITDTAPRSAITIQHDVIWVYTTALCERPGDASACTIVAGAERPAFDSHQACDAPREVDLARAANPRLLGTCRKQHQA